MLRRPAADTETIGELFSRLVEDGKALVRAEVDYYRLLVTRRVAGLKVAAILIVVALLLAQASLTTLLIGIGLAIAQLFHRIGVAGGVVIAAVIGLLASALMVRIAIGRIAVAATGSGDAAK